MAAKKASKAAKKVSKPTMAEAYKSAAKKSGGTPVPTPPDRYPIPQKPTRTGPETESYVKTPKSQGPKRTGPERGPGAAARPPYGDTYGKPKPVDGGALRAQARVVSAAEKRLEKEKKKFKDMQPTVSALPPSAPNKPKKKPKRPKFGPGDSGGMPTYDYFS